MYRPGGAASSPENLRLAAIVRITAKITQVHFFDSVNRAICGTDAADGVARFDLRLRLDPEGIWVRVTRWSQAGQSPVIRDRAQSVVDRLN